MNEWRKRELGELVAAAGGYVRTGPFGAQLHAHEYTDDPFGIPVVMPKDMVHGRVDRRSVRRVDHQTAERLRVHRLAAGDVVLARRGDVGRLAAVADDEAGWLCGTGSMRVHAPDHEVLCSGFLRHAMSHPDVGEWLAGQAVGATMPNLNAEIVSRLPLSVPLVATQRRIAALLSAFDELIEINMRRIELLEDLAQWLYREWFVRFRFPGCEKVPLVNSDFGRIPQGWAVAPLREVLVRHIGGGWGASTPTDKHDRVARVVRGTDIPRARVLDVATCPTRYHTSANVKARWLQHGDIVLEVSGGSKGQPVGRSVFVSNELLAELGMGAICASFCKLLRCEPTKLAPEILAYRLTDAYFNREIETYQVQSTGITNLRFSQLLESFGVILPPQTIQSAFGEIVGPMRLLTASLGAQIRNLSTSRDVLLPRLVTGRLDISDLELGALLPEAP